ncbi:MAG: hypothetical protein Aurels2KO_45900 [Aureliella sp.]
MGMILLFALVTSLAISSGLFAAAIVVWIRMRTNPSRNILLACAAVLGIVGWASYFSFSSWNNQISDMDPSAQAAAFVPLVLAVGLTPGAASLVVLIATAIIWFSDWPKVHD